MKCKMNLNLLVAIFISLSSIALAQTEKKQFLIGGQYGLNFSTNTTTFNGNDNSFVKGKMRSLKIMPQVGYFFLNNTAIGLEPLYSFEKNIGQENQGYADYDYIRSFSIIPFLRYYVGHGKFKPYLHAGVGPGWRKTGSKNYNFPEATQKSGVFFYELRGGLALFINDHISFDFGMGYESTKIIYKEPMSDGSSDKWNTLQKGINSTIGIVVCI